ncbi:MAG: hypothetical protein GY771_03480 [bacterium]|nr:hypothetical protein [bacterium]
MAIVEGPKDAMLISCALGIRALCTLGASLGKEQLSHVRRVASRYYRAYLMMDRDDVGIRATRLLMRAMPRHEGLRVPRYLGKDPSEGSVFGGINALKVAVNDAPTTRE